MRQQEGDGEEEREQERSEREGEREEEREEERERESRMGRGIPQYPILRLCCPLCGQHIN